MNKEQIIELLKNVTYKPGWVYHVKEDGDRLYLQITFIDTNFPVRTKQYCRKWFLSPNMTPSEIVQTALKATIAAEEHECREIFRYKLQPIFGPHFDIEALVELCREGRLDVRSEVSA